MRKLLTIVFIIITLVFLSYLWPESPAFPQPPISAVQSNEPADTETSLRRAYFTDMSRDDVISHYQSQFHNVITQRFNYPPEEAQTIIRDQTRSWYLEELSHPFRESMYINGFIPQEDKDKIIIGDTSYYQKITIKYVPTSRLVRLITGLSTLAVTYLVLISILEFLPKIVHIIKNSLKITIK